MDSLIPLMWKQFRVQRGEVLELVSEATEAKNELAKTAARLDLLRRLIELEGEKVELPPALNVLVRGSPRRKAA